MDDTLLHKTSIKGQWDAASIAKQLFIEILDSTSHEGLGSPDPLHAMLDARWNDVKDGPWDSANEDPQNCLCRELWHRATGILASMQFDEEKIPIWGIRDKAVEVMRWARRNSSPKVIADYWTPQAAESLWNLRMKYDVVATLGLTARHLQALVLVDDRFTDILEEQKCLALQLARSVFAEVISSTQNVEQVLEGHVLCNSDGLESSRTLFFESLAQTAGFFLLSKYCDETFDGSDVEVTQRAFIARRWADKMLAIFVKD
ncbi:MAG: hypothetical protein JWR25_458 [Noviherbaspirillum sp.]|nr:hypothetical protein [Noviherbaspirillum sp.]